MNRKDTLRERARALADTILHTIRQEYPNALRHTMANPNDRPLPHEVHPSFYGCLDWHSAVEMHWALVRLLRTLPEQIPEAEARSVLNEHLSSDRIAVEAEYFEGHRGFERPYGWGWALMLIHEAATWDDADARRWTIALEPLAEVLETRYLEWLPKAIYPQRDGMHSNSAFGLARALPFARHRSERLTSEIEAAARRWFSQDRNYPASWEPSGADFLSPALTEAELMASISDNFVDWFRAFLPEIPSSLLEPARVSDSTDGQMAHLHGLNLSRAYCWAKVAEAMSPDDEHLASIRKAVERHTDAALPFVIGGDYMVEHWLAAYAILLLTN